MLDVCIYTFIQRFSIIFIFVILIVIFYFPFAASFFIIISNIFVIMLVLILGLVLVLKECDIVVGLIGSFHRINCSLFGLWIGGVSILSAILQLYPHFSPQSPLVSSQNQHSSSNSPDRQAPPTKAYK